MEDKAYFKELFKTADTKEKLLLLKWKLSKYPYFKKLFLEEFTRLEISTVNREKIVAKLIEAYNHNENIYKAARKINNDYKISLTTMIISLNNYMKLYEEKTHEYEILNTIKNTIRLGIRQEKRLEENELDYTISIEIMTIFINSNCKTFDEFYKLTNCPFKDFKMAEDILREKNHPLYSEYKNIKDKQRKESFNRGAKATKITNSKEEEKIIASLNNLSKEELIELFKNHNSKEFKLFCKINKIVEPLLIVLIQKNSNLLSVIANNLELYYKYEEYYKRLIKKVITKIENSSFSFYEYYLETSLDLNSLWNIANLFNDIPNKIVIRDFYNKHKSSLVLLTEDQIQLILNNGKLSVGNETIAINNKKISDAVKYLRFQNIPISKAVLFEVIKNWSYIESYKNKYYASFLNEATSIEELLILKWKWNKSILNHHFAVVIETSNSNIERIAGENAQSNKENIIKDLINGSSLNDIKEKYITTAKAIRTIISEYLKSENYNKKILNIKIAVNDIYGPEEQDRDFICALTAFKMFVEHKCFNKASIKEEFNCGTCDYDKFKGILESRNHPLINKFNKIIERNSKKSISIASSERHDLTRKEKEEKIKNYTNLTFEEALTILSTPEAEDFKYFCLFYGLNTTRLINFLKDNPNLRYELASNINNKDKIKAIYNRCIFKYQILANQVVNKIEKLKEDNYNTPFDLYGYYSNTTIDLNYLALMNVGYSSEVTQQIQEYIVTFPSLFQKIEKRHLEILKSSQIISCCGESTRFTSKDLRKAFEDIREKKLPCIKGVLYGAIKRQIEFKDEKIKKKV